MALLFPQLPDTLTVTAYTWCTSLLWIYGLHLSHLWLVLPEAYTLYPVFWLRCSDGTMPLRILPSGFVVRR